MGSSKYEQDHTEHRPRLSGLTKKIVYTDKTLSAVLGVKEGTLVSYAEISKGIHKYIKERDLKNLHQVELKATDQPEAPRESMPSASESTAANVCRDCGESIPEEAVYCDMCGVMQ